MISLTSQWSIAVVPIWAITDVQFSVKNIPALPLFPLNLLTTDAAESLYIFLTLFMELDSDGSSNSLIISSSVILSCLLCLPLPISSIILSILCTSSLYSLSNSSDRRSGFGSLGYVVGTYSVVVYSLVVISPCIVEWVTVVGVDDVVVVLLLWPVTNLEH